MTINKSKLTIEQFTEIEQALTAIKAQLDPLFTTAWEGGAYRLGRDIADLQQTMQGLILYDASPVRMGGRRFKRSGQFHCEVSAYCGIGLRRGE